MSITYTWKITRLEVINKDGLDNVAIQACFDVSGVDEDDHRGFTQSDVMLLPPNPDTFTDISSVTAEQAVAWTKAALGDRVAEFEGRVAEQIGWQKEERPQSIDLPWMNTESANT